MSLDPCVLDMMSKAKDDALGRSFLRWWLLLISSRHQVVCMCSEPGGKNTRGPIDRSTLVNFDSKDKNVVQKLLGFLEKTNFEWENELFRTSRIFSSGPQ